MTRDEQRYYEEQLSMFLTAGWKHFASQVEGMRVSTDTIRGVEPEDVRFRQGELSIIEWVLGWPAMLKQAYEEREHEQEQEKAGAE